MPLRKAIVSTSALADNSGSFVNVTADRLHIRMLDLRSLTEAGAATVGDNAGCSIDEVPVRQDNVNDSRSHIMRIGAVVTGGTGAVDFDEKQKTLIFNRNDLVLDPDEAIFMNTTDIAGGLDVTFTLNIWYED